MPALQLACCFPSEASCLQGLALEPTWKIAKDTTGAPVKLLGDVTLALLNQCQDLCRQGAFHRDALCGLSVTSPGRFLC